MLPCELASGQADRHLAVVLLTAILPGDADRMLVLLRKAGVIDDPVAPALQAQSRQDPIAHACHDRGVRPLGLGHEMVQRAHGLNLLSAGFYTV